jgi:hypothetical protein
MDKKQINDPKMTWNFLNWVGGVSMLSLFALRRILCGGSSSQLCGGKKNGLISEAKFRRGNLVGG